MRNKEYDRTVKGIYQGTPNSGLHPIQEEEARKARFAAGYGEMERSSNANSPGRGNVYDKIKDGKYSYE